MPEWLALILLGLACLILGYCIRGLQDNRRRVREARDEYKRADDLVKVLEQDYVETRARIVALKARTAGIATELEEYLSSAKKEGT